MVDFATFRPERPFQDLVLKHLRPGDIYTHTYLRAVPMLDAEDKVLPYLFEAKKRGIDRVVPRPRRGIGSIADG